MKTFVFAFLLVAISAGIQAGGETKARHTFSPGEAMDDRLRSQTLLAWAPFERLIGRSPKPRVNAGNPTPQAQAVQTTKPHAPTQKDLEDCRAVVDKEGHGPDPGSAEWWAACERLRARKAAPSFDCSKASGQVEELICSDPELAALDVELARLYRAVSAQTTGHKLKTLRTYQRGWIKGRNDCWKAVGVGVRACVEVSYRDRIRELKSQL